MNYHSFTERCVKMSKTSIIKLKTSDGFVKCIQAFTIIIWDESSASNLNSKILDIKTYSLKIDEEVGIFMAFILMITIYIIFKGYSKFKYWDTLFDIVNYHKLGLTYHWSLGGLVGLSMALHLDLHWL